MKIVVYGPNRRIGVLRGDDVVDVNRAFAKYAYEAEGDGAPRLLASALAPPRLRDFIEAGPRAIECAEKALAHLDESGSDCDADGMIVPVKDTQLHPPLATRANRIMNLGGNFADHMRDYRLHRMREVVTLDKIRAEVRAQGIWGFYKIAECAIGNGESLTYPAHTEQLDYEGEVAIIFGQHAKNQQSGRLLDYIWGYTLQNDWSLRDQAENPLGSFATAKNFDGCSSLGPCVVVGEISDPQNIPFETRVNGEIRQSANTRDMIFSFGEAFEYLSRHFTIRMGDVLSAGTAAGTAVDLPSDDATGAINLSYFANPGDVVEVASPAIGTLRNQVIAAPAVVQGPV